MVFVATKQVTEKIYGLDSTIYITLFTNDFPKKVTEMVTVMTDKEI